MLQDNDVLILDGWIESLWFMNSLYICKAYLTINYFKISSFITCLKDSLPKGLYLYSGISQLK